MTRLTDYLPGRRASSHRSGRLAGALCFVVCLLLASGCVTDAGSEAPDSGDVVQVGQSLPAFSVTLSDGTSVSDLSLRGRAAVIVFFHTTCRDCQRELPELQAVYDELQPQAHFVCISRAEPAADVSAYWSDHNLTLPYSAQTDRVVYNLFARHTIPRVYVADAGGTVRACFVEQVDTDSLRHLLRNL